jgi:glycosyltransferase involved in cell wall biosynthesis
MKVAIVHDYIKEFGGAEKVLLELHRLFPEAPIYTSLYAPEYLGPHRLNFEKMNIRASFLNAIPYREKLISIFRLISPLAFYSFDLAKFDVIIVSQTGAYFPNLVRKGPSTKLICYTHTPPRYLYGYMTAREWQKDTLMRIFGSLANHFLRMVDFKASENVDYFIANSEEVRARIQKFYRRDATVIYPPVDRLGLHTLEVKATPTSRVKKEYYLAGGRLARAKGIDIIVEAFLKNGKPLKIFGRGFAGYDEELRDKVKNQKSKIEFLGEVSDKEKLELMKNATAYVFASYDEDFGITPVEAMAAGTPVIAYRSGGVRETVIDPSATSGQAATGIFFDENTPEAINNAIERFETLRQAQGGKLYDACRQQSQKFSAEVFDKNIKQLIAKIIVK